MADLGVMHGGGGQASFPPPHRSRNPLIAARVSWGSAKAHPAGPGEPGRQMYFGAF